MTNVVLTTDAVQSVRCDGMEISLTIKCEGLSMQASLRKVQESADQLLGTLQAVSVDPSSFSIEKLDSLSFDDSQKQSARIVLKARGACDFEMMQRIWTTITQMPFSIEMQVRFYLEDEDSYFQALHENALVQAQIQAGKYSQLLGSSFPTCLSLKFENLHEECQSLQSLNSCSPEEYLDNNFPSFWSQAKPPYVTLKTVAETSWTFSSLNS